MVIVIQLLIDVVKVSGEKVAMIYPREPAGVFCTRSSSLASFPSRTFGGYPKKTTLFNRRLINFGTMCSSGSNRVPLFPSNQGFPDSQNRTSRRVFELASDVTTVTAEKSPEESNPYCIYKLYLLLFSIGLILNFIGTIEKPPKYKCDNTNSESNENDYESELEDEACYGFNIYERLEENVTN